MRLVAVGDVVHQVSELVLSPINNFLVTVHPELDFLAARVFGAQAIDVFLDAVLKPKLFGEVEHEIDVVHHVPFF